MKMSNVCNGFAIIFTIFAAKRREYSELQFDENNKNGIFSYFK